MFPSKTVDGSIEDWHNQNEGEGDQVRKQAFWSPESGEMYIMYILKPKSKFVFFVHVGIFV